MERLLLCQTGPEQDVVYSDPLPDLNHQNHHHHFHLVGAHHHHHLLHQPHFAQQGQEYWLVLLINKVKICIRNICGKYKYDEPHA